MTKLKNHYQLLGYVPENLKYKPYGNDEQNRDFRSSYLLNFCFEDYYGAFLKRINSTTKIVNFLYINDN